MNTIKIDTPVEIAQGVDGDAWIKIKTRIKGKYRRKLLKYQQMGLEIASIDTDNLNGNVEALTELSGEFIRYDEEEIPKLLAALITDWNWQDDETEEGLSLNVGNIQNELDHVQITWLLAQVTEVLRDRVTEGNPSKDIG